MKGTQIRKTTYRGNPGFLVCHDMAKIFVKTRETAEALRHVYRKFGEHARCAECSNVVGELLSSEKDRPAGPDPKEAAQRAALDAVSGARWPWAARYTEFERLAHVPELCALATLDLLFEGDEQDEGYHEVKASLVDGLVSYLTGE